MKKRIHNFPVNYIMAQIKKRRRDIIKVRGYDVFVDERTKTYIENGTVCRHCGIKATHWGLDHDKYWKGHLNLYATDESGEEVLMTSDHIIPKSKGGSDDVSNRQCLCLRCNQKKADTDEDQIQKQKDM